MTVDPYVATYARLSHVARCLTLFRLDFGRWPDSLSDLITKPAWAKEENYPSGGYMREVPVDGWGRAIEYRRLPNSDKQYNLISHGAHGDSPVHDLDIIHDYGRRFF